MLMAVAKDIRQFLAVLMVILIAFTYSFFLLLKDSVIEPGVDSTFEQVPISFIAVFDMMYGSFDLEYFRKAPNPLLAITHFILFMVIVPTVMLNALIAIMSDTFERVQ